MRLFHPLKNLGFEVEDISQRDPNGPVTVTFKLIVNDLKMFVDVTQEHQVTFNYYKGDEPRKLDFKVTYVDDEFLIVNYLEDFIEDYGKGLLDK